MSDNSPNLIFNPGNSSIPGFIREALRSFSQSFQTCIPAIIKEVKSRDLVVATPAVLQTGSNWESVPWADITLTVLTPFGGNMFLSFPCAAGDTGWIVGADLDTSLFKKSKTSPQRQNTFERHQYRFGFFIPDAINGYTISSDDEGSVVLSSMDGKSKLVINEQSVKIVSGKSEISAGDSEISINNPGNVIINGINWNEHTHQVPSGIAVTVTPSTGTGQTTATAETGGPK